MDGHPVLLMLGVMLAKLKLKNGATPLSVKLDGGKAEITSCSKKKNMLHYFY
jgi:hypothetical protein